MAKEIEFPELEPVYIADRDCLIFRAIAYDKPVECVVTAGLLMANFGALDIDKESLLKSYQEHKPDIHTLAMNHIENGWIDEEGRVFLTKRFTRLKVTYGDHYDESPAVRSLVDTAHRILLNLIGPNAEKVNVEWSGEEYPPRISVQIIDPDTLHSSKIFFNAKDSADSNTVSISLARLWSKVLRERSLKLDLKMS